MTTIQNFGNIPFFQAGNLQSSSDTLGLGASSSTSIFDTSPFKMQLKQKQDDLKKLKKRLDRASEGSKDLLKKRIKNLEQEIKQTNSLVQADSMAQDMMQKYMNKMQSSKTSQTSKD